MTNRTRLAEANMIADIIQDPRRIDRSLCVDSDGYYYTTETRDSIGTDGNLFLRPHVVIGSDTASDRDNCLDQAFAYLDQLGEMFAKGDAPEMTAVHPRLDIRNYRLEYRRGEAQDTVLLVNILTGEATGQAIVDQDVIDNYLSNPRDIYGMIVKTKGELDPRQFGKLLGARTDSISMAWSEGQLVLRPETSRTDETPEMDQIGAAACERWNADLFTGATKS